MSTDSSSAAKANEAYLIPPEVPPLADVNCLHVEFCSFCNTSGLGGTCPLCPSQTAQLSKRVLDKELFFRLIDDLSDSVDMIKVVGHGEPTVNPHTWEMIAYAQAHGVNVFLGTNGTTLHGKNIDKFVSSDLWFLEITLDGMDEEAHHFTRPGVPFKRIMDTLEALHDLKQKGAVSTEIQVSTLASRANEDQLEDIKTFAEGMGFRHRTQLLSFGHNMLGDRQALIRKYAPTRRELFRKSEKRVFLDDYSELCISFCPFGKMAFVQGDGVVVKCCYGFEESIVLGKLDAETSFADIWFSEAHKAILRRMHAAELDFCNKSFCGRVYRKKSDGSLVLQQEA